jgi:NNP family nitrate/nitrite transporter-like MFS transporter
MTGACTSCTTGSQANKGGGAGMGGFILSIMFGALMDLTGIRSSTFMLMYGVVWVSLRWM